MSYPQDVAWPTLGVPHLVYHADDVGFNFCYPFGGYIEVSAGGYGEPLSHLITFYPLEGANWSAAELVSRFTIACVEWANRARNNDLNGHGWFSDPDSDLPYIRKGENV